MSISFWLRIKNRVINFINHINDYSKKQSKNILKEIEEDHKIEAVPNAFWFLLSSDRDLKVRTSKSLHQLIRSLSSSQLTKLDNIFRDRTSFEWYYDWKNEEPYQLISSDLTLEEQITIFGLCSFHPNGYFREKAILALSKIPASTVLPYLLIRLNDWVIQVRNCAESSVLKRLNTGNAPDIVQNLPLIFRLQQLKRAEFNRIIDKVISILSEPECFPQVEKGLKSSDYQVRLGCYEIIIQTGAFSTPKIISYLIHDKNSNIRRLIFERIQDQLNEADFMEFYPALIKDKYGPIKKLTLELLHKFLKSASTNEFEKALHDQNTSVRELARYFLKKYGKYDYPAIYRSAIKIGTFRLGTIAGLGETGGQNDAQYLEVFLNEKSPRIVRTTIRALAKLHFSNYKDIFMQLLNDPRPGVSKEAKSILSKQIDSNDADRIYHYYKDSRFQHARVNSSLLLCTLSKWYALKYILEFCASDEEVITNIGTCYLQKWIVQYNRSFVSPSNEQLNSIKKALTEFGPKINENVRNFIKFNLKAFDKK